jgi:hypothetical protein
LKNQDKYGKILVINHSVRLSNKTTAHREVVLSGKGEPL